MPYNDNNRRLSKGFHISQWARDHYQLDEFPFTAEGAVFLTNTRSAHLLADKVNEVEAGSPPLKAGQVNALGTITGIMRFVVDLYSNRINPGAVENALTWVETELGPDTVDEACSTFRNQFLATTGENEPAELESRKQFVSSKASVLREMLLLWLENDNPAASRLAGLFEDQVMRSDTAYAKIISALCNFLSQQQRLGPRGESLVDLLRSPLIAEPESLAGQLEYIKREWGSLLDEYLVGVLSALDFIEEEEKPRFAGPGPPRAMRIESLEGEPENYSIDKEWMPSLVLVAKNALVWMEQLSKKYDRSIERLDEIPDEELDLLAQRGFTGIWLIGVWERSGASTKIKELCGSYGVTASAYSLFEYAIASALGGEEACEILREKARLRGIRLGADMVPNHTGIYSKWIVEHPDWYVSTNHSPYPSYSFHGADLSQDERVGLFLEDHYYDKTDAAVVFKHVDRMSGRERYVYHGNDGTLMPWNDTAQLNYLKPEVREAVMNTILHVARLFPIIRFDAAMTLTKMHYQRLWFPEPGTGGAVPSRSEHGMSKEKFSESMPMEFWRQVVDHIADEVPDTLLLAEAFWLTEGYFVRTLGMHRVYNSAFMNMLREEENSAYRKLIKDTLVFDPEILKRYVNFMNNPDEETAVVQFGKDGKYFGICTMMATMPGLPMFGHGQIEGLSEKYGAEFSGSQWNEKTDENLVQRHEREIFPLLKKRNLFSGVDDFVFYDFVTAEGTVDENVFIYSNRLGNESALVVYHNKWGTTRGTIKTSVPALIRLSNGEREEKTRSLSDGLGISENRNTYVTFRDTVTRLEYIACNIEISQHGFDMELGAYSYHVFQDFEEVSENDEGLFSRLWKDLAGKGTQSLAEKARELRLEPIHHAFRELVSFQMVQRIEESLSADQEMQRDVLDQFEAKALALFEAVKQFKGIQADEIAFAKAIREELRSLVSDRISDKKEAPNGILGWGAIKSLALESVSLMNLTVFVSFHALGRFVISAEGNEPTNDWMAELLAEKLLSETFHDLNLDEARTGELVLLFQALESYRAHGTDICPDLSVLPTFFQAIFELSHVREFLQINAYQGTQWFSKERFGQFLCWMAIAIYSQAAPEERSGLPETCSAFVRNAFAAADAAGYSVDGFLAEHI